MRDALRWLGLSLLVVVLDQITKYAILSSLHFGERVNVLSFFDLVLVFNTGAAFSFLADHDGWQRWFLVALAVVICGWLVRMMSRNSDRLLLLACALIVGGAIGNVIDRLEHGAVVDFLYFYVGRYGWPAFNLADSAITLGAALMVWAEFRNSRRQAREFSSREKT